MKIKEIKARQILDSRGNPTVEAEVQLDGEVSGVASVPSGASTGEYEAVELRDGEMVHFWGKGVMKAVENVEQVIGPVLQGMEVTEQKEIDGRMIELDGTENKSKLGANAILAVSLACARAAAESNGIELFEYLRTLGVPQQVETSHGFKSVRDDTADLKSLSAVSNKKGSGVDLPGWETGGYRLPVPFMNVINGGKHAVDGVDFQEFMLVPHGFGNFAEALESADEVFQKLKEILHQDGYETLVGDEGGFAPAFKKNDQALNYLMKAIGKAGFEPGKQVALAMDPAASEIRVKDQEAFLYQLKTENRQLTTDELIEYWLEVVKKYPIVSLEDPLDEDDWEGWKELDSRFKIQDSRLQIVGDDLLVTNPKRLQRAIDEQACNAILVKLNQIGTLTETIEVINLAHKNGFNCMISHRSGETEDTFIADLAVGMGTGQIKAGSLSRSDRVAKYNRLLRIEEMLSEK